jgi:hypothetical protein
MSSPRFARLRAAHLIHVSPVMVLTTSETSTTGMLPVLSYTSMTG